MLCPSVAERTSDAHPSGSNHCWSPGPSRPRATRKIACHQAGVEYSTLNYPRAGGDSTFLTGVCGVAGSSEVYISGFYAPPGSTAGIAGLIYKGATSGGGTSRAITMAPSATRRGRWRRPIRSLPRTSWACTSAQVLRSATVM